MNNGYVKNGFITVGKGNGKLDSKVISFSIPSQKTCNPKFKDCWGECFGYHEEVRYPTVMPCREQNLFASKLESFVPDMNHLINKKIKGNIIIRPNTVGDFYSSDYFDKWMEIIKSNPEKKFYCYTKFLKYSNKKLPNFNLIKSILPDGELNFGTPDYILSLHKKYKGSYVCPNVPRKNKVSCMGQCYACLDKKIVLFLKH